MNSELLKNLMPTQKNGKIDRELSLYAQEVLMQDIDISLMIFKIFYPMQKKKQKLKEKLQRTC